MSETPPIITAVATNRAGTVAVRATQHAIPVDLRIRPDELRYGGARLAEQILALATEAATAARAQHRVELENSGVPSTILDRLDLPTREEAAAAEEDRTAPSSWMRTL